MIHHVDTFLTCTTMVCTSWFPAVAEFTGFFYRHISFGDLMEMLGEMSWIVIFDIKASEENSTVGGLPGSVKDAR